MYGEIRYNQSKIDWYLYQISVFTIEISDPVSCKSANWENHSFQMKKAAIFHKKTHVQKDFRKAGNIFFQRYRIHKNSRELYDASDISRKICSKDMLITERSQNL